jgi:putative iron-regulated protein
MKRTLSVIAGIFLASQAWAVPTEKEVVKHYADLAHAMYEDSLFTARELLKAVNTLVEKPTDANMITARAAWKAARMPYQQTEAYRFGNAIVDEWEGKVNAWPLDEGLIDYVATSYGDESDENYYYTANIIANKKLELSGETIDASRITKKLLSETLHEIDEVETNVATGYHAIEFLLWGQDLNGNGPGAGNRPASDYDVKNCTVGHCDRRGDYLKAVTELLVDELEWITAQWAAGGEARKSLTQGNPQQGIATIFSGMGSLSYGELAGERMKLGLMVHDPEEEHDCFSDNTHWSHYNDALGIKNVYTGTYTRINGEKIIGPSVSDLVAAKDAKVDKQLRAMLDTTMAKMQVLVDSAEKEGVAYDQLIAEGNKEGNAKVMDAIKALLAQTKGIEKAVNTLQLEPIGFEGSDSLDNH